MTTGKQPLNSNRTSIRLENSSETNFLKKYLAQMLLKHSQKLPSEPATIIKFLKTNSNPSKPHNSKLTVILKGYYQISVRLPFPSKFWTLFSHTFFHSKVISSQINIKFSFFSPPDNITQAPPTPSTEWDLKALSDPSYLISFSEVC